MKSVFSFSKREAEEQGKYKIYFYLFVIAALLALMILTEFGTKFIR